jgi:transcriptional regulator with PAS, ATPase and Fis domain
VREMLVKLSTAPLRACVLDGETGVGKGLAARILHYSGARASGPLVEVNCAALPRDLLESELFGHEAGAFTGAKTRHHGLIERANTGTLFLDEIGDLDPALQGKLLRAIEDGRVRRIGGEREFDVDVRFLAASNHDLDALVRSGAFREDLYHRLNVFGLQIPPLRQRLEDLPDLVSLFIEEYNVIASKRVRHVSDEVWRKLRRYSWPGNIRELRNVVERCVLLSEGDDFPEQWLLLPSEAPNAAATNGSSDVRLPLDGSMALDEMESHVIRTALERTGHNVMAAARLLGTTRQTLRYRIEKYGITCPKHLP